MQAWEEIQSVAVIGAGAIGSYYGARLAHAGIDITFLLRSDYEHVSKHGLSVSSIDGDFELPEVSCQRASEDIGHVDLVIVAWKTTSNKNYHRVITPLLHENTLIITLQNGLGSTDELAHLFGAHRVYGALCFIGVNRLSPGRIDHAATAGPTKVGKYEPCGQALGTEGRERLDRLVDFLDRGGVSCEAEESLERAQWMKLIWNIPFNGLTISEGGVDTSVLFTIVDMESRIRCIMHEVQAVAEAFGHIIDDEVIELQIKKTKQMRGYRPSSMIDYVEGQEVEVDAIWREPLRRAGEMSVPVPEIQKLLGEIELRIKNRM